MPPTNAPYNPEVIARITRLGLRAQRLVEGALSGAHRSPLHGRSVEFAEYREYAPGDAFRQIDWRVFARTDRLYIKRFEEESNLRAMLVTDASASMSYRGSRALLSKFDAAATLAASLAILLVKQRDAAGLALADRDARLVLPPASTQAQTARIVEALEQTRPDRETDLGPVLARFAESMPRRTLTIVISDLLTDPAGLRDGLARLQHRGHDIVLIHVLDRDEIDLPFAGSVRFQDIEGDDQVLAEPRLFQKTYQDAMRRFCDDTATQARAAGMDYLRVLSDENLGAVLSHFLHRRQRARGGGAPRSGLRAGPRSGAEPSNPPAGNGQAAPHRTDPPASPPA